MSQQSHDIISNNPSCTKERSHAFRRQRSVLSYHKGQLFFCLLQKRNKNYNAVKESILTSDSFFPNKTYFSLNNIKLIIILKYLSIYLMLYSPLLDLGHFFSFLILYTVGRTPWTRDQPIARPLLTRITTQTQNKRTQTSMP
jgi:hypothetical protein